MKNLQQKLSSHLLAWLTLGLLGIFGISLILRFWGLERFNTLVFDEVYYAKFANSYLLNKEFFNAHPPLSQYIIAIGIWIGSHLPFGQTAINTETGSTLSPWDYRWLNALTGAFIPVVVGLLAYQLTRRHLYAFLASLLIAADGLFLVESRYALNNVYLVIFGLLGQLAVLIALQKTDRQRWLWLIFAGSNFGASACIKWNGLWFLLGIYLIITWAWFDKLCWQKPQDKTFFHPSIITNLTQLKIHQLIITLGIVPLLIYSLLWLPHLQLNPQYSFKQMQYEILTYHQRIKSGPDVHPYCSTWYSWPLMIRPVVYFYKSIKSGEIDPVLPSNTSDQSPTIYDVHAMGNPILYWFSTSAILLLIFRLGYQFLGWLSVVQKKINLAMFAPDSALVFPQTRELWLGIYLVTQWAANLLPWIKVTRCIFIYHYMGSSVFATLTLAWWLDKWLHSAKSYLRITALTAIFFVLIGFIFWLPIYLGLPISQTEWQIRMWFRSWI